MAEQEIGQTWNTQIDFPVILKDVKNYNDIQIAIGKEIGRLKGLGIKKIGFVSGKIGNPNINDKKLFDESCRNDRERMRKLTKELGERNKFPIFSSTDIFIDPIWNVLEETNLAEEERKPLMINLFNKILESGVTDIYMMEGWGQERIKGEGNGAIAEFKTAKFLEIEIHDLDPTKPSERLINNSNN